MSNFKEESRYRFLEEIWMKLWEYGGIAKKGYDFFIDFEGNGEDNICER